MVEEARQALGLAVGQDEWVVLGSDLARRRFHPPPDAVAGEFSLPMLELDQMQAAGGQDQEGRPR